MRWRALIAAIPVSGVAITLLELTRLPASAHAPARLLAALAQLARSAFTTFAVPALLLVATALVLSEETRPRLRKWALAGLGILQVAMAREVLIGYGPFANSVPITLALLLLGLGTAAFQVGLAHPPRGARLAGIGLALASLLAARMHYAVYVGLYPTMHQAALQLCFLGCALGVALVLGSLESPTARSMRLAVALTAGFAAVGLVEVPASAWARPVVTAYTELGRVAGMAAAFERDADRLLPTELPGPRRSVLLTPDDDAEARFRERSGLADVDFALEDLDVLLVMVDATRFDRTSLADPARRTTPRLAALARRGAFVHTRAMSPSNGTFHSLSAIFSMRPLSFSDVDMRQPRFWHGALRDERRVAPEVLRDAGRETFWVGHDHGHCFSEYAVGLDRGFERRVLIEEMADAPPRDVDAEIATAAIEELRRTEGRFFGMVFFASPHDPYWGGYDAELRRFDAALGRLIRAVDLRHTIVIVAGDHGEAFGDHGFQHHLTSVYDEQVHVPLVIWIPGLDGGRRDAPTSTGYLFPWLFLRGGEAEQEAARAVLREDVGPLMRVLDGAVLSEMIGPSRQEAALAWADTTVVYDVLAELPRVFDPRTDPTQLRDLREEDEARVERMLPYVDRYRRARFEGQRFRFVHMEDPR